VAPIGGSTIMLAWIITALAFVLTPAKD
jgi:hypothetical protein